MSRTSRIHTIALAVLLTASVLVVMPPSRAEALPIFKTNPVGNLSVVSGTASPVSNRPGVWADIPGLSTAAYTSAGDTLTATVSAEIRGTGATFVRVLVDGFGTVPGDVLFKWGGQDTDGVRSYTFGRSGLTAGRHVVQAQWWTTFGESAEARYRTLSVDTAATGTGTGRLVTIGAESNWISNTTGNTWLDIPNLSTSITTGQTSNLKITFSAQTSQSNGQFFVRAVMDNLATLDVLLEDTNATGAGARSFSFAFNGVAAGTHSIRIQWILQGSVIWIADRTLSVFAAPATTTGGGLVNKSTRLGTTITSTAFQAVPELSATFTSNEPSAVAELEVDATVQALGGRLLLRATVDGTIVAPDVPFVERRAWQTKSFRFVLRNIKPGTHTVQMQMAVDAGVTGSVGDRALHVTFKRRAGVDFVQPYNSLKARTGTFPVVVVCFDPRRPGIPAPTQAFMRAVHEGTDGGRNMVSWFVENTRGQFKPASFQYIGCNDSGWLPAPPGRQGTWYWDNGQFGLMWEDALKAADPFIDFHAFDTDRSGHLSGDEVAVEIVRPETGSGGFVRTASAPLDGQGTLTIDINDAYLAALNDTASRNLTVGLLSHETSHLTLGAVDMYANVTTRANNYSLMDWHGDTTHLDPFHKLKSGFVTPDVVEINTWATRNVNLLAVETRHEITIVYDPARADKEYFILENRWRGSTSAPTYDLLLPVQGIVVWHIVEDIALQDAFPPPGSPVASGDWGRKGIRKIAVLGSTGASQTLTWADGTAAGIRVTTREGPQERLSTEIAKV